MLSGYFAFAVITQFRPLAAPQLPDTALGEQGKPALGWFYKSTTVYRTRYRVLCNQDAPTIRHAAFGRGFLSQAAG